MTDNSSQISPVSKQYQYLVSAGAIESDGTQIEIVKKLDVLSRILTESRQKEKKGVLKSFLWKDSFASDPIKGLYIWGPVGRGKTMLMDIFYATCKIPKKRRLHFHEFMTEIHDLIHHHRQAHKRGEVNEDDPIPPVARKIVKATRLLCFDEFSVTDIADAMILSRLFTQLFSKGVVVVVTSNVEPSELYKDGLNRSLFLPFVGLLEEHVEILNLVARTDYRLEKLSGNAVYLTPLGLETTKQMNSIWVDLTDCLNGEENWLDVKGRRIKIPRTASGAARFTFDDLCRNPNGVAEYIGIAKSYHTVFVDDIPVLHQSERNEARRFINLIDTLYDRRIKLVASAHTRPEEIYQGKIGQEVTEFQRTVSRLIEMQSSEYLDEVKNLRNQTDN